MIVAHVFMLVMPARNAVTCSTILQISPAETKSPSQNKLHRQSHVRTQTPPRGVRLQESSNHRGSLGIGLSFGPRRMSSSRLKSFQTGSRVLCVARVIPKAACWSGTTVVCVSTDSLSRRVAVSKTELQATWGLVGALGRLDRGVTRARGGGGGGGIC